MIVPAGEEGAADELGNTLGDELGDDIGNVATNETSEDYDKDSAQTGGELQDEDGVAFGPMSSVMSGVDSF